MQYEHSGTLREDGEGIRRAEGEERDERELGSVGVKRREQDLARFEALVVCDEVVFFLFSFFLFCSSPERQ